MLIPSEDNQAASMTSVQVAELVNKMHKHVLADIRKLIKRLELSSTDAGKEILKDIKESSYTGKNNRPLVCYTMGKKFTLMLVSGYSAEMRASVINYIDIAETERSLTQKEPFSQKELPKYAPLSAWQVRTIKLAVNKIALVHLNKDSQENIRRSMYAWLRKTYAVRSYMDIPADKYIESMKALKEQHKTYAQSTLFILRNSDNALVPENHSPKRLVDEAVWEKYRKLNPTHRTPTEMHRIWGVSASEIGKIIKGLYGNLVSNPDYIHVIPVKTMPHTNASNRIVDVTLYSPEVQRGVFFFLVQNGKIDENGVPVKD